MNIDIPRIKVCCLQNKSEALAALKIGVDAIGIVHDSEVGHKTITLDKIREITQSIPPSIDVFVLTRSTNSWDLIDLIRSVKNRTIQLVDRLSLGNYLEIRSSIPCVKIAQSIRVTSEDAFETAVKVDPFVDLIILDSGNPQSFSPDNDNQEQFTDWDLCRQIVEHVDTPVFLAGGLTIDNVADIVESVKPFGVDVCKGVRSDGKLDIQKLGKFIRIIRGYKS